MNAAAPLPESAPEIRPLIVIPVYNNAATLRAVVAGALETGLSVLVANDGSTDGGPENLDDLPIKRIDLTHNQGKGAAILQAAAWAAARGFTHLLTIDADGQHDPREAIRFVKKIRENPWAIIVGSRRFDAAVPGASRFGRRFSNFWLKAATGIGLADSQSGYRAYPLAALRRLKCAGRRYDFEVEILVRAAWAGLALESIDVSVHYEPEGRRVSHFRPLLDNLRISKIYARSVIRNFFPWPHRALKAAGMPDAERLSLKRPGRAIKMLLRESTTPRQIATASMLGLFLGALPLIGIHGIAIVFCATRLRLNRLVAFNISHLCAPPLVPALAIELGYYLRNGRWLTEITMRTLALEIHQRFFEWFLGSLVVGPALALAGGALVYFLARGYQLAASRRRAREVCLATPQGSNPE